MTTTVAPCSDEVLQHADEGFHVQRVQPDGGLVEDEEGVVLVAAHLAGELQPLGLAAGKCGVASPKVR